MRKKVIIILGYGRGRDNLIKGRFLFRGLEVDCKVVGIEPLKFEREWEEAKKLANLEIINKAAATYNGIAKISIHPTYGKASTNKDKMDYFESKVIEVPCFNFSRWIERYRGWEVIVEMDIEGDEFKILPKMIEDGTFDIINKLIIEFHEDKLKGNYSKIKDKILSAARKHKIKLEEE